MQLQEAMLLHHFNLIVKKPGRKFILKLHQNANTAAIRHLVILDGANLAQSFSHQFRYAIAQPTDTNFLTDFHLNSKTTSHESVYQRPVPDLAIGEQKR